MSKIGLTGTSFMLMMEYQRIEMKIYIMIEIVTLYSLCWIWTL